MTKAKENKEKSKSSWKQNPERVKQDILRAAMSEFAKSGLSGAKIDDIAAKTETSKRMIYYYFDDKEGLYRHALEAAYAKVRKGEVNLDLADYAPTEGLARLVAFTFDHHRRNPDFIRMVMIENIHHAAHMRSSQVIRDLNLGAINQLRALIARGEASGDFRRGIDPVALHWQISAMSFFNVSNQPTFSAIFGKDLYSNDGQAALRDRAVAMILADVRATSEDQDDQS
ncbi:TetR/AcrR family transcriptional regulator [Pseudoprimorskyibacter insulae]|uniref:HTH-type transcriptional repressor NicS n=1 Tax=Pseudoprimorskyibacter insulae TaxID=1695997 RepID=A0A2R8AR29_9RHOB|nr:TetR/AcrR family transcriptional regulator [Pseudoprimorskyibacter insulae]SPF78337.1 HTH-type transcriptional repressor NicS [Pseudoprimorskyibacter insulae]